MVIETMHMAGVTLLVFRVLPFFGSMFALSILYATCLVPALFKLLFTKAELSNQKDTGTNFKHYFICMPKGACFAHMLLFNHNE